MLNKTINGNTIKHKLGEGGMADVWYAENKIGKPAAVKILHPDLALNASIAERFLNEAKVMVKLTHPNIRQVYDYDEIDGRPCIIMEYLEGKDMKAIVRECGRIDSATAVRYWNEIASALSYTHEKGVIHRDIKPSNIFMTEDGYIKLLDFGIAKVRDTVSGTQTGQKLGTLVYMSPEQIVDAKHVGSPTDLYSLAVTFVHLLSGRIPYDTDSSSDFVIMDQIVRHPLNMKGVPSAWQLFLQPYLSKKPKERPELVSFNNDEAQREIHSGGSHSHYTLSDDTYVESSNKLVEELNAGKDKFFKVKGIPFKMVYVEGGTFEMGSNDSDAYSDESPVHSITVSNYYLGETEVTQELWKAIMGRTPSFFTGADLPVENVSWDDCQKFIQKLNQLSGMLFRLPMEAEWEYAARGGIHQSKSKYSGSNVIEEVAWYKGNSNSPQKVRLKSPNEIGLYDMSGNVWEWCGDWYNGNYYGSSPKINPQGMPSGSNRVLRGGGWNYKSNSCRVTCRHCDKPSNWSFSYGLRLALSY